jgi:flagellar export protein FliJ
MTALRDQDRGLKAVARVREVRERDSRLGLIRATNEHRVRLREAEQLDEIVRSHAKGIATDGRPVTDWAARRSGLVALTAEAGRARDGVAAAAVLRTAAEEYWQRDRTRLRAVAHLLELREDARRSAIAAAEARELDDIGGQLWLRAREGQP